MEDAARKVATDQLEGPGHRRPTIPIIRVSGRRPHLTLFQMFCMKQFVAGLEAVRRGRYLTALVQPLGERVRSQA